MNAEQINNALELCKGKPIDVVVKLIDLMWSASVSDMAEHFGCANDKQAVAERLSNGGENHAEETDTEEVLEDLPLAEETTEEEPTEEVKADTEKKAEKKEVKLSPYEKIILAEMTKRAENGDDTLADAMKSKDKTIQGCFSYVTFQARKKAVGNCAMIADEEVYGWAHHYYIESKETIDAEMKPKQTPKPTTATTATKDKKGKDKPKPVTNVKDIQQAIVTATKTEDGKKPKREKKKDNLNAGFVPMERPETIKDAKKGSREQAKSVEQGEFSFEW